MTQISLPSVLQAPLRADEPELVMKKTFRATEVERVRSFPVLQVEPPHPPIPPSPPALAVEEAYPLAFSVLFRLYFRSLCTTRLLRSQTVGF